MAASSTVSPSTKGPLPNNDAVSGRDDICRLLCHNQNQLHPSSSLKQLLLVPCQDEESREEFIAAGFEEDSVASSSSSFGLSVPPIVQEQPAVSEHLSSEDKSLVEGGEGSRNSDGSEECSTSSVWCKPHKGNDARWEAIRAIRSRDGDLGLGHFSLRKKLGCGDIGTVYLAELSGTKCCFAMKMMNKEALVTRKKQPRAQTEKDILERLDHPFLPTLYTHFETDQYSCLVMDYCPGGDLHALRQRWPGKCFSEQAARFYVAEILLALEYLHMLGIVYRDLKPENVLVREDGHIMLSDFDLSLCCTFSPTLIKWSNSDPDNPKSAHCAQSACMIQPACFAPRFFCRKVTQGAKSRGADSSLSKSIPEIMVEPTGARSMSFVGTHEYLAPEIIKGEGHGSAVDWWTLGIFLYELLFRKTPFKGSDNRATLFNVVGEPLRFPDTPAISFPARDLIRGLLVKEPQQRLAYRRGATELKHHPFFHSLNWALIRCDSPPEMPVLCKTAFRH